MSSTSNQVIINLTTNPIPGGALTMCALAQPARQSLSQGQIDDLRLAASKMTGAERRAFMAEMALKYCSGSARRAETVFSWGRETVEVGLAEKRTGLICFGAQSALLRSPTLGREATGGGRRAAPVGRSPGATGPDLSHRAGLYPFDGEGGSGSAAWPRLWRGATALAQHHGGGIESPRLSAAQSGQGQAPKEAQGDQCYLRQPQKKDHQALEAGNVKRLRWTAKRR